MTAPRSLRELFDQIGLREVESSDDSLTMEMPVDERVVNSAGGLQGGLIATMADVTAGQLAARITPFGNGIATRICSSAICVPSKSARRAPSLGSCGRADDPLSCRLTFIGPTTTRSVRPRP